ncbi:MAG: NAD(P)-binding domain-containing protein [Candidatus Dormibacteraeota bacterium]|nr:NAD(P)-binding domain-containing protein [Candidatus Dormibacteraeota bacterium]
MTAHIETVIVGGGQAGLSVGYHLARHGRPFVILDAGRRVGDSWRNRWDSLRLFTPARADGLDGMPFPGPGDRFITKNQMADYLESYAERFELPIRSGVRVERLSRNGRGFLVEAARSTLEADNVVVAMANHQEPWTPDFAMDLRPEILQLHARDYHNQSQLREGSVLVVGLGNSGADIAMDVVSGRPTVVAGKETGHVPIRIEGFFGRQVVTRMIRFAMHHVLTLKTPIGRKALPRMAHRAAPLIRVRPQDLVDAGVVRVPRISGVKDGLPTTADGQTLDVANVIWCTGFRPGFTWIDLPVLGDRQEPLHQAGMVPEVPGLYFVGLHFLYAMSSATISGVGRDAQRIVNHIVAAQPRRRSDRGNAPESVAAELAG